MKFCYRFIFCARMHYKMLIICHPHKYHNFFNVRSYFQKVSFFSRDTVEGGRSEEDFLESSQIDYDREGKFLQFYVSWMTTTSTSTSTSYTSTTTIGELGCTPNGFTMSQCPQQWKEIDWGFAYLCYLTIKDHYEKSILYKNLEF